MQTDARRARFEAIAAEVYEPLQRYLRRRCSPDDADDLLNDVLLVLWRRLDDAPLEPLPWCYGVARRCIANHRRGAGRRLRLVKRAQSTRPAETNGAWVGEADAALHEALGQLPELDREVIRLWAWERLEPREISEVLDTTPNAISLRLTRARRQLRIQLDRQNPGVGGHKVSQRHPELKP